MVAKFLKPTVLNLTKLGPCKPGFNIKNRVFSSKTQGCKDS